MIRLTFLFSFMLFGSVLFAQEEDEQYPPIRAYVLNDNVIKTNISQWLNSEANLTYERIIDNRFSIQLRPSYFLTNPEFVNSTVDNESGLGIDVEAKFYFAHDAEAPQGFYFSPFYVNSWLTEEIEANPDQNIEADTDRLYLWQVGLSIGYQKIIGERWVFDANMGNGRAETVGRDLEDDDQIDSGFDGFQPRLSIGVGYNF